MLWYMRLIAALGIMTAGIGTLPSSNEIVAGLGLLVAGVALGIEAIHLHYTTGAN